MEVVFARYTRERIALVIDRIGEILRHTAQEIRRFFFVVKRSDDRKRIDEHSEGITDLDVASAVGDRDDGNGILTDESAKGNKACGKVDRRGRYAVFLREFLYRRDLGLYGHAVFCMRKIFREHIGDKLCGLLHLCHFLREEVLGFGGDLLLSRKVIVCIALGLGLFAVKRLAQAFKEQVHRRAVADKMVHIHQQIQRIGLDYLKPHAGTGR